jgi:hypothetical protein
VIGNNGCCCLHRNCGGALSIYTPIILFFGAFFLVVLLQKDLLMVLGIAMKGKDENRSWLFNQIREKGAMAATMIVLMFLQSAVVQFSSIMFRYDSLLLCVTLLHHSNAHVCYEPRLYVSVWNITRSCSDFDHEGTYSLLMLCYFLGYLTDINVMVMVLV